MTLTDKQRVVLKQHVFDSCMSNMFGDGMERDYVADGFPAFKGVNHMSDEELLEEAGCGMDMDELKALFEEIES